MKMTIPTQEILGRATRPSPIHPNQVRAALRAVRSTIAPHLNLKNPLPLELGKPAWRLPLNGQLKDRSVHDAVPGTLCSKDAYELQ